MRRFFLSELFLMHAYGTFKKTSFKPWLNFNIKLTKRVHVLYFHNIIQNKIKMEWHRKTSQNKEKTIKPVLTIRETVQLITHILRCQHHFTFIIIFNMQKFIKQS